MMVRGTRRKVARIEVDDDPVAESLRGVFATDEALAKIAWSYSRRSTLEQCTRRYYYEYFGANKLLARQEPDKERLHRLKGVQNRFERAGFILHLAVGTYLRRSREGEVWDADRLTNWARGMFRSDREYSAAHPEGDVVVPVKFPPVLLLEYHNRVPNASDLCAEAEERLSQALRSFATDERWDEFRLAGTAPAALVERRLRVTSLPCRVEGRLDLAYPSLEGAIVVDWKLGVGDGNGDDSLQLAVYALWATGHFGCSPEALRICKAHLGSGEIVYFRADDSVLAAARARIVQDAERMVALQDYGRDGVVAAFTPCLQPGVCRHCSFCRVCLG